MRNKALVNHILPDTFFKANGKNKKKSYAKSKL